MKQISSHPSILYKTESFEESTDILNNPYMGFYRIVRYVLSDKKEPEQYDIDSYDLSLVLLEINLKEFRDSTVSKHALLQLEDILSSWSQCPSKPQLILRFLYDWDGIAMVTEPESIETVIVHMYQVRTIINQHSDMIYILQGIFVGNWGEMHHSRFTDDASIIRLVTHLHEFISPSVFLSVRTPDQYRLIEDEAVKKRLGLFNDGILGSLTDLGTYAEDHREEELSFQNRICSQVPNGGEVVYNAILSDPEASVSAFRQMHVSYLNAEYDTRVYERWKKTTWKGNDVFNGCNGYHYILPHLGYRYVIRSMEIRRKGLFKAEYELALTMENTGFSSTLKPFKAVLVLKNQDTEETVKIPSDMDFKALYSQMKKECTVPLPVNSLTPGTYGIFLSVIDETSGRKILLANQNELTDEGYTIGTLEIGNAR